MIQPHRGDDVEEWIKRFRDRYYELGGESLAALDDLLNDYRLHADTGTPLTEEVSGAH